MKYDVIVVGCGYAGAVCARLLAENSGRKVLILDRRITIAGNMYDYMNEYGILTHKYGPHIPVIHDRNVFEFLSKFTEWLPYEHRVNAEVDGKEIPLPFNLNSIEILFEKSLACELIKSLVKTYGFGNQITILEMLKSKDEKIKQLAEYVYEKVFLDYTIKMWGKSPLELDPSVTGRVPVRISYDNRHFMHKYQFMPKQGFTKLFETMLDHENIEIKLDIDAKNILNIDLENKIIYFQDCVFKGKLIYTGAIDELLNYKYGFLPYRSLLFEIKNHKMEYVQNTSVLNWPDKRSATRRTEMKRLTGQIVLGTTTTITEYPGEYDKNNQFDEPYYPILNNRNMELYQRYRNILDDINGFYALGRLAEYKYYNMEDVIKAAFNLYYTKLS